MKGWCEEPSSVVVSAFSFQPREFKCGRLCLYHKAALGTPTTKFSDGETIDRII
jgi:hypothetical protein